MGERSDRHFEGLDSEKRVEIRYLVGGSGGGYGT